MDALRFKEEFGESTLQLFLLGTLSFGIYYFIWLAERRKPLNELANFDIYDKNLLIFAAIFNGLPALLSSMNNPSLLIFIYLLEIAYSVLIIVITWKIGKWFEGFANRWWGVEIKANGFLLVLFNIFYVNYLFNKACELYENPNV